MTIRSLQIVGVIDVYVKIFSTVVGGTSEPVLLAAGLAVGVLSISVVVLDPDDLVAST